MLGGGRGQAKADAGGKEGGKEQTEEKEAGGAVGGPGQARTEAGLCMWPGWGPRLRLGGAQRTSGQECGHSGGWRDSCFS